MSKEEAELQHEFVLLPSPPPNSQPSQKIPASDGEEISLGDLTIPPELTKIESRNENHKKLSLIQPSNKLEENLDKNMTKNYKKIDDRMELKIMPFNYIKWTNKNYICIGHTVMRLVIQYFWEINNLFDSMGKRIAINKIWKYTMLDFSAGFAVINQNQVNRRV